MSGALAAAGCADEPEPDALDNDHVGSSDASQPKPIADGGSSADAGKDAGWNVAPVYGVAVDAGVMPIPPYGISVPVYGVAIDASTVPVKDGGASCPQLGNLPAPVYGISIDPVPIQQCNDAGADAGKDAGAPDAGKDAGADAGKDSGLIVAPPYGIAVPTYGIAIDPNH